MQTLKTVTFFGTVSNPATSRTSKSGRHYTAFGVSILDTKRQQTFHYNVVPSASRASSPASSRRAHALSSLSRRSHTARQHSLHPTSHRNLRAAGSSGRSGLEQRLSLRLRSSSFSEVEFSAHDLLGAALSKGPAAPAASKPAPPSCGAPAHGRPDRARSSVSAPTSGYAVVNDHAALPRRRCIAHPATIAVPLQHRLPQPAEVLLVLSPKCVAGRTHAVCQHCLPPAATMHRELNGVGNSAQITGPMPSSPENHRQRNA